MPNSYIDIKGTSYEIIHSNSKGKISIATKNGGIFKPLVYGKYSELKVPEVNSLFSINTFIGLRKKENIFELKANFVEFDFASEEDKEQFLFEYRKGCFDIPKPTLLVSSGHGIWSLLLYKDAPICRMKGKVNETMLKKWKTIQKALFDRLSEYSVYLPDPHSIDVSRVMRPSGSINHKPGLDPVRVEILEYNEDCYYTMEELLTFFTGKSRQDYFVEQAAAQSASKAAAKAAKEIAKAKANAKIKKSNSGNRKSNYNLSKTNRDRVSDFEKLVQIRQNGFRNGCGYRELYLFVYAYHVQILTGNIHKTLDKVRALNNQFADPLLDNELTTSVINSVEQGVKNREIVILTGPYAGKRMGYNYKTSNLIKLLQIDENEQKQLKTLCSGDDKYNRNKRHKKANRRNENGLTKREQKKINNIYLVHFYASQGLKQSDIAGITNLTESTVSKYLNKYDCPAKSAVSKVSEEVS